MDFSRMIVMFWILLETESNCVCDIVPILYTCIDYRHAGNSMESLDRVWGIAFDI
jgi:hypothetical protein